MFLRCRFLLALLVACVWVPVTTAQAGDPRPAPASAQAIRVDRAPVLDGRDDDAAWRDAPLIDGFRQFAPAEDAPTAFRTTTRVIYDEKNIYVFVRAYDPHPDSIVSLLSRRDVRTNSDQIKILIDSYHDRRTGVELMVNPAGVQRDAAMHSDVVEDMSWDGIWDVKAVIDSLGWTAEFRVPFSQLRFNSAGTHTFGFGIWRDIARLNQRDSWPVYRGSRATLVSQLGELSGFAGIGGGHRVELLPYTVTKNVTERSGTGWNHPQRITAGADLKVGLGSALTASATMNPDFGQVEADPALLNLSAFEVRFDERRPFFLEGNALFRCNGPCEGLFYTRRIGRSPQLRASTADPAFTTILGAAKVTGRVGRGVSIGISEAITRREVGASGTTIEPQANYFAARVVQEMRGGRSQLGVMVTDTRRALDSVTRPLLRSDASVFLLQGFHRFGADRYELSGYTGSVGVHGSPEAIALTQRSSVHFWQRPDHERTYDSTRTAMTGGVFSAQVQKLAGMLRWSSNWRYASAGMEANDIGFVILVNDMSLRNQVTLQQLRPTTYFRRLSGTLSNETHWTTGGTQSGASVTTSVTGELRNFWTTHLMLTTYDIGGTRCVACARGGPALRQSAERMVVASIGGDPRRLFTPGLSWVGSRGDDGKSASNNLSVSGELRLASRYSMSLGASVERRTDDQQWIGNYGAFRSDTTHFTFARLAQRTIGITARANWTATPTLSLQVYAQPFITSGAFSDWRELIAPRAKEYAARYGAYGDGAAPEGFNFRQFNSNAVLRWEYRPGSTLFFVWQQGRTSDDTNGEFRVARDYRDLFRSHPDNTLLIKASYWFNL
ncbi:MAG: carbohydrate binding family 9 domain-containing protein [Gemmatimonadaceae bacterium]|nr:carbohydrate binding family 9 domain-containing protein [Gemmatimonadaceae bacterium]